MYYIKYIRKKRKKTKIVKIDVATYKHTCSYNSKYVEKQTCLYLFLGAYRKKE